MIYRKNRYWERKISKIIFFLKNRAQGLFAITIERIIHASCFTHFLKTCSESIDFTGWGFENGCPTAIFEDVFAKKEK